LYICYFGLHEPLVQTQVLPYLRQLAASEIKVHLLTFEGHSQTSIDQTKAEQQLLTEQGINWRSLTYHKRPSLPATLYDVVMGARVAAALARQEKIQVLHARAHMPLAMALLAQRLTRTKLIFDLRGLMAEEYADAGIWRAGSLVFRVVKRLERIGIRRADQIVVLTERMRNWLITHNLKCAEEIEVIPCCVDCERFAESVADTRFETQEGGRFEVVYAGSLVGLYLVEEMGRFFKAVKKHRPEAFFRLLSVSPPGPAVMALTRGGLNENDFEIRAVPPADVPAYLARARLGLSFRKSTFAQIAASPTKIPEYLAAGVPVVCNAGIGDTDELVTRERVGVVLPTFDDASFEVAAVQALALVDDLDVGARCQHVAGKYFDLQTVGGPRYLQVYRRLFDRAAEKVQVET
ncbi:MAG TPA: glycosyltransferase, partial [Terriglobales bacterium]|nr:glycosyltransferase [Terriglobales bacterium]